MGFSPEETASYFTNGGEAAELLAILEDKLILLQRNVEELRIRAITDSDMSVQIMTLPETVCCTRRYTLLTIQEKYDAMYNFFHVCVPVQPESAPESAVRFPSCKALSVLFYGDYNRLDEAWLRLGREAKERGLVPAIC